MSLSMKVVTGVLLDERHPLSCSELCNLCRVEATVVVEMVAEGLLSPLGSSPRDWMFPGPEIARARRAARLIHDFELDVSAATLVVDLLEEIEKLRIHAKELESRLEGSGSD